MHPDLIARTCGSVGVLGALVYVGVLGTPKFIITPQQNFESVMLSIQVNERPSAQQPGIMPPEEELTAEPEPATVAAAPEPEMVEPPEPPAPEPPHPEPQFEPEPPPPPLVEQPSPVKQDLKPKVKPEPQNRPEPDQQVKPKPEPKPKPKAENEPVKKQSEKKDEERRQPQPVEAAPDRKDENTRAPVGTPPPAAADHAAEDEASARQINAQLASLLVKEIRSKLHYPRNAVRRKLEGTVMVEFIVKNGVVVNFNIEKSSGHRILDEAASKLARSLIRFNTRLDAMSNRVLIPIKYELL